MPATTPAGTPPTSASLPRRREPDATDRNRRVAALTDLIILPIPVDQAVAAVAELDWDSDRHLVTLHRADAVAVLRRYLTGALTGQHLRAWAQALEGRDDLDTEPGTGTLLWDLLFELATPELVEPGLSIPDDILARRWLDRLFADTPTPAGPGT